MRQRVMCRDNILSKPGSVVFQTEPTELINIPVKIDPNMPLGRMELQDKFGKCVGYIDQIELPKQMIELRKVQEEIIRLLNKYGEYREVVLLENLIDWLNQFGNEIIVRYDHVWVIERKIE